MLHNLSFVLGLFLYFPEDKREYIPAAFTMAIFLLLAILTMRFLIIYNRKEERKAKEFEEKLNHHESNDQ